MSDRICALFAAVLLFFGVTLERTPALKGFDVKEFYLGKDNSCCVIYNVDEDAESEYKRLFDVCGERAATLDEYDVTELLTMFDARFVFEESTQTTLGRYYYSDKISAYKLVNGKKINLHTVFDGKSYSVGTPIIFGSY